MEKITSNSEVLKTLLQSEEDENTFIGGNCKVVFSSEPAKLKFILCDVEIDSQETIENDKSKKDTSGKIIQRDSYLEEIKSLKAEVKRSNELLENILAVLEEKELL